MKNLKKIKGLALFLTALILFTASTVSVMAAKKKPNPVLIKLKVPNKLHKINFSKEQIKQIHAIYKKLYSEKDIARLNELPDLMKAAKKGSDEKKKLSQERATLLKEKEYIKQIKNILTKEQLAARAGKGSTKKDQKESKSKKPPKKKKK